MTPNPVFADPPTNQIAQVVCEKPRERRAVLTLKDAVALWLDQHHIGLQERTKERAGEVMRDFLAFVGERQVDARCLADYWADCARRGLMAGTVKLHGWKLSTMFRWLKRQGYILESPMDTAPRPPAVRLKEPEIITLDEYKRLLAVEYGDKWAPYKWLFTLAWNTGMSLGDCCLLQWRDVDLEKCEINVVRRKTQRFGRECRIVYEPGGELAEFLAILDRVEREDVWPNDPATGTWYVHIRAAAMYRDRGRTELAGAFRRIAAEAGVRGKSFHCFRRAWCSRLVNSGMSFNQVALTTGHTKPQVLQRYVKPDREKLRASITAAFAEERRAAAAVAEKSELKTTVTTGGL